MTNSLSVFFLISSVMTFLLGLWVYGRQPKNPINFSWFIFCFFVSLWSFGLGVLTQTSNERVANIFYFVHYLGAINLPVAFLYFIQVYFKRDSRVTPAVAAGIVLALLQCGLFLKGDLVAPLSPKWEFLFYTNPGKFYPAFMAYFFLYVLYSFVLMLQSIFRETNTGEKQKKLFLMAATAIGYLSGSSAFLLVYVDKLPPYPIYIFLLFPMITTYGIFKHRLLDVEVIVKKTLVFTGLFAMIMTIVVAATALTQTYLGKTLRLHPAVSTAFVVMIAMILYDPLRKLLSNLTDKYLFQKTFKLTSMAMQASEAIALVQSLKWLSRRIVAFLVTKCRIRNAVIYVRSQTHEVFHRGAWRGYPQTVLPMPLIETHQALIRRLEQTRRPLEIYRLQDELGHRRSTDYAAIEIREILAVFHALNVELIVPSFIRRRLDLEGIGKERVPGEEDVEMRNILMLGGKKSDEPYSDDELEVFYSLAQESAIAVENARLYDEAIKRTALLERMNRELADINARLQVTQASLIVAEKNATMVGMAKAIGHEINNPLTSVILPVEKIRRETGRLSQFFKEKVAPLIGEEDRAKIEKALGEIDKSSERANRSAYRINAVVHTLTHILKNSKEGMQPLSLIVLCREAVEATRFSTYEENLTGCEIVLNIASNLIIMGNLDQLLQVFINLIKNAYEAMSNPRDRRIEIAADVDAADRRMAHIEFKDNGPGIPPEILPKIWLQGFSTKEKHGSGLGVPGQGQGLFVCKHMIESLHKGTISVESTMGQGTTFMIRLPLAEDCQIHE